MNYNIVSYLIGEGFKNVLKNKKSTFAAFIIMFVTMITVGLGIAGGSNITSIINQLENDFPINVYIEDTASQDDIKDMEEQIKSIEYVNNVTYTSKEKALEKERENLGDTANVVLNSYTESNHPFPASFTVTLTDLEKSSEVIAILQQLDNIKKDENGNPCVITKQDTITGLNKVKKGIRIAFFSIGALLIVISTIIISNTIKLTVHARRREISIMKYVGATNNFIRAPFIVEGIVIGVIAVAASLLITGGIYELVYNACNRMITATFNCQLLLFKDIFYENLLVFSVLGIGIGVLGSSLSMKKYLKV